MRKIRLLFLLFLASAALAACDPPVITPPEPDPDDGTTPDSIKPGPEGQG